MSLSEVILEIAEEMIREADDMKSTNGFAWMALRGYAKQLKVAVKAAEGSKEITYPTDSIQGGGQLFLHPEAQHFQMIEQARKELREQKRKTDLQEGGEPRFVVCQGGPADGDTVSVAPDMPTGARTMIDGGVYSLQGKGLEFDEVATRARKEGK